MRKLHSQNKRIGSKDRVNVAHESMRVDESSNSLVRRAPFLMHYHPRSSALINFEHVHNFDESYTCLSRLLSTLWSVILV